MNKITIIAPYSKFAQEFHKVAQGRQAVSYLEGEPLEQFEFDIQVQYDQNILKELKLSGDVIIARGYSAVLLRNQNPDIPVVEVSILPNDIIRCIHECKQRFGARTIVFPGTEGIIAHANYLSALLDVEIELIEMPHTMGKETERAFSKIKAKNFVLIGGRPICKLAEQVGYDYVLIESGYEAMYRALVEAQRIAYFGRKEKEKSQSIHTILNTYVDGIIALDRNNRIIQFNLMAEKMLQQREALVLGQPFEEVFHQEDFCSLCLCNRNFSDELIRYHQNLLVVGKIGVFLENHQVGSVITLQYASRLQEVEGKIRNKINEREHTAQYRFYDILGDSPIMQQTLQAAHRFSATDSSILIVGKSGTGKELFAQSIHNASKRRKCPFLALNCAAIPENLLESELFGYVEGAFTGAVKGGKPGLIELAHRGTLFLDEISELPLNLQGRLLRVLQEKEIRRLGGDKTIRVDIRVISATNRDLLAWVAQGRFREDLYYRLDVLKLELPALRERREDIPILVQRFMESFALKMGVLKASLSAEQLAALQRLPWNGNVRELRNVCERLTVLSQDGDIPQELFLQLIQEKQASTQAAPPEQPAKRRNKEISREEVSRLLEQGMSRINIAIALGIDRSTLWRKMKLWQLE